MGPAQAGDQGWCRRLLARRADVDNDLAAVGKRGQQAARQHITAGLLLLLLLEVAAVTNSTVCFCCWRGVAAVRWQDRGERHKRPQVARPSAADEAGSAHVRPGQLRRHHLCVGLVMEASSRSSGGGCRCCCTAREVG
jgi:hypothetical protein